MYLEETQKFKTGDVIVSGILLRRNIREASLEQIRMYHIPSGLPGVVQLRHFGAAAAEEGRLDVVRFFVEERGCPINTITREEEEYMLNSEKDGEEHMRTTPLFRSLHEEIGEEHMRTTPLFGSLTNCHEEIAMYLIDRLQKEEIDTQGPRNQTCLHIAAKSGMLKAVRRLVDLGADVGACPPGGHTAICYATSKNHMDVTHFLLEDAMKAGGEELQRGLIQRPCGSCPNPMLSLAISNDNILFMEYLVEKEGRQILSTVFLVNTLDANFKLEMTPLHLAAMLNNKDIVDWILDQGVPVDLATPTTKYTALHVLCRNLQDVGSDHDFLPLVRHLIDQKHANFHLKDAKGELPVDLARKHGAGPILAYLRTKERVEARRARRNDGAGAGAAAALSEEEMRQARAAADAAAEALLADVENEGAAGAVGAAATAAGGIRSGRNGNGRKKRKNRNRNRSRGGEEKKEEEEEEAGGSRDEEQEEEEDTSTVGDVGAALGGMGIGEEEVTARTTATLVEGSTAAASTFSPSPPPSPSAADQNGGDDAAAAADNDAKAFEDFLLDNAPDVLVCPITGELFQHPVVAMDSHTYEKAALEAWVAKCKSKGQPLLSPKTNLPMAEGMIFVQSTKTQVIEYRELKKKEWEETGGGKMKG
jgi:ankyrin repeat protein